MRKIPRTRVLWDTGYRPPGRYPRRGPTHTACGARRANRGRDCAAQIAAAATAHAAQSAAMSSQSWRDWAAEKASAAAEKAASLREPAVERSGSGERGSGRFALPSMDMSAIKSAASDVASWAQEKAASARPASSPVVQRAAAAPATSSTTARALSPAERADLDLDGTAGHIARGGFGKVALQFPDRMLPLASRAEGLREATACVSASGMAKRSARPLREMVSKSWQYA